MQTIATHLHSTQELHGLLHAIVSQPATHGPLVPVEKKNKKKQLMPAVHGKASDSSSLSMTHNTRASLDS